MPEPNAYGDPSAARTGLVCRVVDENGKDIDCSKPTPIEPKGIVYGTAQLFDTDGRPLTVLEMNRLRNTYEPNEAGS